MEDNMHKVKIILSNQAHICAPMTGAKRKTLG